MGGDRQECDGKKGEVATCYKVIRSQGGEKENEEVIEVISGLEENDRLVVKGFETLRDKSKVKILR